MKKALVEFIGTFFLVFTIGMSVRSGATLAPFAIAASLMAVIYGGGHASGAHYNPAVTLAAVIRGCIARADVVPYLAAQFLAALAAGGLTIFLAGGVETPAQHPVVASLIVEFLFTFALAWVILNVATAKGTSGNSFYGAAIAMVVLGGAIAVGGISGGAFNPAVALALFVMGMESAQQLAVYFVAQLAGGVAAAFVFLGVNGRD